MELVPVDVSRPEGAVVSRVRDVIAAGGVVAVPTDTVYGLVADAADAAAVERIYALKGRDRCKPLAGFVADAPGAWAVCADVPAEARVLAKAFWPGALTLVLRAGETCPPALVSPKGAVGLRVVRSRFIEALCGMCGRPLASTSANRSGGADPLDASDVVRAFGDELELVVDGGRGPCAVPSTVVRVGREGGKRVSVLREGGVCAGAVRWALGADLSACRRILFVCTGNICRSAYAEARLRMMLEEAGVDGVEVSSAGLVASGGVGMYPEMARVLSERGGDGSAHRSRPLDAGAVAAADVLLCMERHQRDAVRDAFPDAADRTFTLGGFVGTGYEIPDPVFGLAPSFDGVADLIDLCVEILAERLRAWLGG